MHPDMEMIGDRNQSTEDDSAIPGPGVRLVSILVVTRNRREALDGLIRSLAAMRTSYSWNLVVVEETDSPRFIPGVCYVPHPLRNRGIAFARNLALKHATGDVVVFIDDDCIPYPDWLDRLLAPFEDPLVAGVQGGVTVPEASTGIGWAESVLGFPGGGISRVVAAAGVPQTTQSISTLNCAYRRSVVDAVGGFNVRLEFSGEDQLLAMRICDQGRCLYVPDAMVAHAPRGRIGAIWKWFLFRGRSEMNISRVTRERHYLGYWFRSSIVVKLALLTMAAAFFPRAWAVWSVGAAGYYGLLVLRWQGRVCRTPAPRITVWVLPIVKMVMDLAMDCGRGIEWLRPKASRQDIGSGQFQPADDATAGIDSKRRSGD